MKKLSIRQRVGLLFLETKGIPTKKSYQQRVSELRSEGNQFIIKNGKYYSV